MHPGTRQSSGIALPGTCQTYLKLLDERRTSSAPSFPHPLGHRNPTSAYKEAVWPGGAAFGLNNSNGGKFMYVGGGIPILVNGECVGAVGCR
jgi:hypothetical protein